MGRGRLGLSWLVSGNVQVTAYGTGNTQCVVEGWDLITAYVRCFSPTGAPVASYFTVLLGS